ncbi:MAG: Ig-like domain-containing protein [Myxococcales bacterium]|nr:Ig-like domain-containing protein [Myxococcales bacterium]
MPAQLPSSCLGQGIWGHLLRGTLLGAALVTLVACGETVVACDPGKAPGTPGSCAKSGDLCGPGTELKGKSCVPSDSADTSTHTDTSAHTDTAATDAAGGTDASKCAPACDGLSCGPDGCGGTCGTCSGDKKHCVDGQCSATCTPSCALKSCGDDGCGGTCGDCASGETCSALARCVPAAWTCPINAYGGDGVCDCGCGAKDPDCAHSGYAIKGCSPGQLCDAGKCVAGPPSGWTCELSVYKDGQTCDCNCGAPDPDCADGKLPVPVCKTGVCSTAGTCGACKPTCDGKSCGPDGCGGVCGICAPNVPVCQDGKCATTCKPTCGDHTCGGDGCGSVCGTCKSGEHCVLGHCQSLPPELSCKSKCGGKATGGCGCDSACVPGTTCCKDITASCGCQPKCDGKVCGDDGCGKSCGSCKSGEACDSGKCVADPCKPNPCGDKGTCLSGACTCVTGFAGAKCDTCAPNYVGYPACVADLCAGQDCGGKGKCDGKTGKCVCNKGFTGQACHICLDAKKVFPACDQPLPPCVGKTCNNQGVCDTTTNKCECSKGFTGENCNQCTDAKQTWPKCGDGKCGLSCKGHGGCVSQNSCLCEAGFTGASCELCTDKTKKWPACGGAKNTNYQPDPAVSGVTCKFCGQSIGKLSGTANPADKTAPILKMLLPPNGTTISPGMPIVVIVDDLLDPKTITPTTFKIHPEGTDKITISGSIVAQVTTNKNTVLVFFPSNLSLPGAYKIKLDGIKDLGGNAMAKVDSSFTLGQEIKGNFTGNLGFESGISGCFAAGDADVVGTTDNISPTVGKAMLGLTTANKGTIGKTGSLAGQATVVYCGPIDVPTGKGKLLFDYNFASSEFDEYVGDKYDDVAIATVSSEKGGVGGVVTSVNLIGKTGALTKAFGLPDQGDKVAKKSGWNTAIMNGVGGLGKSVFLTFIVSDVADTAYSSALAVDNVRFQ